jgi:pimeloyl-ACP methyl ester carboxylesterase
MHLSITQPSPEPVRLYSERMGEGGRVVSLMHGWPLTALAWKRQVATLRTAGYRLIAYGAGDTDGAYAVEAGFTNEVLCDDVQRVLDHSGLNPVTLVGFAKGRGEVTRYTGRHAESGLHIWCSPRRYRPA